MKRIALLLLVALALPILAQDAPVWPWSGVTLRSALRSAGLSESTPAFQVQWRITYTTRDDRPALMADPLWLAADPRWAAGTFSTRVWTQRFAPAQNGGTHGTYCALGSFSVSSALGTVVTFPLAIPSTIGLDDMIAVEHRIGLRHSIEINTVAGGPWYPAGAALTEFSSTPAGQFRPYPASYVACQ